MFRGQPLRRLLQLELKRFLHPRPYILLLAGQWLVHYNYSATAALSCKLPVTLSDLEQTYSLECEVLYLFGRIWMFLLPARIERLDSDRSTLGSVRFASISKLCYLRGRAAII